MTEAELLAAIHSGPRSSRLVYADWLTERGDPRGELIRLCERMRRLAPHGDRYWRLKPRRDELQSSVDSEWLERLGYATPHRPLFASLPRKRGHRWRLVSLWLELWGGPIGASSDCRAADFAEAEARIGAPMPAALREWHIVAGPSMSAWSVQDHQQPLHELAWQDDVLVIRIENQGCERWGIRRSDLSLSDPPVVRVDEPGLESPSITEFAILTLLIETVLGAEHGASNWVADPHPEHDAVEQRFLSRLSRCNVSTSYWALTPVQLYEGDGLLAMWTETDGGLMIVTTTLARYMALDPDVRRALPLS